MPLTFDEILEQLSKGQPPFEVTLASMSDDERSLLNRCALTRSFDRRTVEEVLRVFPTKIGDGVAIEDLGRWSFVTADSAEGDALRIDEGDRQKMLGPWTSAREIRDLDERLAEHYEGRGRPLDALYHRAAADARAATPRIEGLFAEAEDRFDLARCQDLVDLLDDPRIASDLAELRNWLRARLSARGFWIDDYYRTTNFVDRPTMEKTAEEFLAGQGRTVLHIHAPGGRGKTQFLRWLIARRCCRDGYASARLDFDREDAAKLVNEPWRLVRALASQYDRQLPNRPLQELINRLDQGRDRDSSRARASFASALSRVDKAATAAEAAGSGGLAFNPGPSDGSPRLLLVLDTLEEVLIPHPADLVNLLKFIEGLREVVRGLRVVLSGRYDLREEGRLYKPLPIPEETFLDLPVPEFTEDEARRYLVEKCDLPGRLGIKDDKNNPDKNVIQAVIDRSGGVPLKLALHVEILEGNSELTAEEVRADPKVDLAYLIRRVVLKLPKALRLVLRYGTVPRAFTLEFLREVIFPCWPVLAEADSLRAGLPPRLGDSFEKFEQPPGDPVALWKELSRYVASSSWVSLALNEAGEEALRFHPDVLDPMRFLLQKEDRTVLETLHRAAIDFLERKAKSDPDREYRWTAQAVFHEFQLRGPNASASWRERFGAPALRLEPEGRLALADVVTSRDFIDDKNRPHLRLDGSPMILPEDLAFAHAQAALAHYEMARSTADPTLAQAQLRSAREDLARFDALARSLPEPLVPPERLVPVRAAALDDTGKMDEARTLLLDAAAAQASSARPSEGALVVYPLGPVEPQEMSEEWIGDRARLLAEAGRILSKLGDRRAITARFSLLDLAGRHADLVPFGVDPAEAGEALAVDQVYHDLLTGAASTCESLLDRHGFLYRSDREDRVHRLVCRVQIRMGRPARALEDAGPWFDMASAEADMKMVPVRAEALLALGLPREALKELGRTRNLSGGSSSSTLLHIYDLLAPERDELRGLASAALMEFENATSCLDRARLAYTSRQDRESADRALAAQIRVKCLDMGRVDEAKSLLGSPRPLGEGKVSEALVDLQILRLRLVDRASKEKLRAVINGLLARGFEEWPPRVVVRLAIAGIIIEVDRDPARYVRSLTNALAEIRPATARLVVLEDLASCPVVPDFASSTTDGLLATLPSDGDILDPHLIPRDQARLLALRAEALRVVGLVGDARSSLERAVRVLDFGEDVVAARGYLRALDRVNSDSSAAFLFSMLRRPLIEGYAEFPVFVASCLLDQAERLLRLDGQAVEIADLLEDAQHRLAGRSGVSIEAVSRRLGLAKRQYADRVGRSRPVDTMGPYASVNDNVGDGLSDGMLEPGDDPPVKAAGPAGPVTWSTLVPTPPARVVAIRIVEQGDLIVDVSIPGRPVRSSRRTVEQLSAFWAELHDLSAESYLTLLEAAQRLASPDFDLISSLNRTLELDDLFADLGSSDRPLDLRIEVDDPSIASIPWELLALTGGPGSPLYLADLPSIRTVYRGRTRPDSGESDARQLRALLRDVAGEDPGERPEDLRRGLSRFQSSVGFPPSGLLDAATRRALEAGRREEDKPGPGILFLGSTGTITREIFGHGVSMPHFYLDRKFRVSEAKLSPNDPLGSLVGLLDGAPTTPRVIHLAAGLDFDPSLGVHLTLGGIDGPDRSTLLTASMLKQAIEKLGLDRPRPLVILDPPRPPAPIEVAHQVLLRNVFAAEVFAAEGLPAVIAAGMGDFDDAPRMAQALAEAMAGRWTLGGLIDLLRRQARKAVGPAPFQIPGSLSVSLLTHDPETRLPYIEIS
jgi:hypothetical protein